MISQDAYLKKMSLLLGQLYSLSQISLTLSKYIKDSLFIENKAYEFGTIAVIFEIINIKNVTLLDNSAIYRTEGISATVSLVYIEDSHF